MSHATRLPSSSHDETRKFRPLPTSADLAGPLNGPDLDLYLEAFLARWERPNTRTAYRDALRSWLRWCNEHGHHPVVGVDRRLVELWVQSLRNAGRATSTIRQRISVLYQFFEVALDDELVAKNPCRLIRRPKMVSDPQQRIAMTRDEMQRFVGAAARATNPADLALVALMGYMGLRVSEACSLDVGDCREIAKAHRCVRFVGKGGRAALVPMPPTVQRAVDAAIAGRTEGPLLLRRDGTRMTRRSADRVVKRIAQASGVTEVTVTPHVLRHTFVVSALDSGVDARTVQLSARHSHVSTTLTVYDRGRQVLDQHAAYSVAGFIGAA